MSPSLILSVPPLTEPVLVTNVTVAFKLVLLPLEFKKNDNSGYTSDGDYLVRNIKSEKLALRSISIGNDIVCMFPLNPNNEIRDITRYVSKEDFYSKYEIIGKVKRLIRDF